MTLTRIAVAVRALPAPPPSTVLIHKSSALGHSWGIINPKWTTRNPTVVERTYHEHTIGS